MLRSNRSCSRVAQLARLQDVSTTNAPRAVRCLPHLLTRNELLKLDRPSDNTWSFCPPLIHYANFAIRHRYSPTAALRTFLGNGLHCAPGRDWLETSPSQTPFTRSRNNRSLSLWASIFTKLIPSLTTLTPSSSMAWFTRFAKVELPREKDCVSHTKLGCFQFVHNTEFEKRFFMNCSFDNDPAPILQAMAFCIVCFDFTPKLANEKFETGENRLDKILELNKYSMFSIHYFSHARLKFLVNIFAWVYCLIWVLM